MIRLTLNGSLDSRGGAEGPAKVVARKFDYVYYHRRHYLGR
jgi:hypothetical protein